MVYLTTASSSVRLIRRHGSFRAASKSPFVPAAADAMARWKHYVFRAFAGRHVLRLVATAGTRDEGAAIAAFLSGLRGLLPRVCRRGGLGGAPLPLSDDDTETIARIEKALRCVLRAVLCLALWVIPANVLHFLGRQQTQDVYVGEPHGELL